MRLCQSYRGYLKYSVVAIVATILSLFFATPSIIVDLQHLTKSVLYGVLAWGAMCRSVNQTATTNTRAQRGTSACMGVLIGQFITIGHNYFHSYSWASMWGNTPACILWVCQSFIYGYTVYRISLWIISWLNSSPAMGIPATFDTRRSLGVLVAIRLVYLAAFYPCIFDFDAALGLRTFLSPESATCDHHPVTVQAIHALFFILGGWIGSRSVGFALLSVVSILASSAIICYGLRLHAQSSLRISWQKAIFWTYAIFPLFPYLSLLTTKDGFFAYAFILYLYTLYELHQTDGQCLTQRRYLALHGVAILSVCLTRHQGLYIVGIETLLLLFCYRQRFQGILRASCPALAIILLLTRIVLPSIGVEPGGRQEMYGSLFQQTAYYLITQPDDVRPEECEAINGILNTDTMVVRYKSYITDPVKNDYIYNPRVNETEHHPRQFRHIDHTGETVSLHAYLKAWVTMGIRHPMTYAKASASIFMGFFYNSGKALIDIFTDGAFLPKATTPAYHFWRIDTVSDLIRRNRKFMATTPIINWIGAIPYYIWLVLLLLMNLCWRRRWRDVVLFCPVFLSIALLLICPVVNGRYIFPIAISLPMLFCHVAQIQDKK